MPFCERQFTAARCHRRPWDRGGHAVTKPAQETCGVGGAEDRTGVSAAGNRAAAPTHPIQLGRVCGASRTAASFWWGALAGPARGSCRQSWGLVHGCEDSGWGSGSEDRSLGSRRSEPRQVELKRRWGHLEAPASLGWPTSSRAMMQVFEAQV